MATVLKHTLCTSCGHHFTLGAGELGASKHFAYRYPETGRPAKLRLEHEGEVVHALPQRTVVPSPAAS
jgi:hypothetical protein